MSEYDQLLARASQRSLTERLWRVYSMNDCDWMIARTLVEAVDAYMRMVVGDHYAQSDIDDYVDEVVELTAAELEARFIFVDEDRGVRHSFAAELEARSLSIAAPELFASTEQ